MSETSFMICLESLDSQKGHLYCDNCICPIPFSGMTDMILKIEVICDILDVPHRFSNVHSGDDYDISHQLLESELRMICRPSRSSSSAFSEYNYNIAFFPVLAFSLVIQSRRDCSWQGVIQEQNGSRQEFLSALELILHIQGSISRRQVFTRHSEHRTPSVEKQHI